MPEKVPTNEEMTALIDLRIQIPQGRQNVMRFIR